MKVCFLTGATGVVGSALLGALLEQPDTRVLALVRGESQREAQARLDRVLAFLGLRAVTERVQAVCGDVTRPHLGIDPPRLPDIARECTHLMHCAGIVRMNLPMEQARAAALGAAGNIVELARRCLDGGRLRKVDVLSTVGVAGRRPGELPERWLAQPRAFHNSYEQAKAEAEEFLAGPSAAGLPLTVYRPSMVVGDSKDGRVIHFQVFYHLAEFLSGARTWGLYPALGNAKLDLVPADYVARAVLAASDSDASVGRVLHLCSGRQGAVSLQGLRTIVREKFRRVGRRVPPAMSLPAPVFRAMLAIAQRLPPGGHSRALSTLPVFLDYLAEEQWFANAQTRAFLEGRGVALPPASQFLDPVLDYYLAHRG